MYIYIYPAHILMYASVCVHDEHSCVSVCILTTSICNRYIQLSVPVYTKLGICIYIPR